MSYIADGILGNAIKITRDKQAHDMIDGISPKPETFEPGDVVWLKSGGPAMTVWSGILHPCEQKLVSVEWFSGTDLRRDVVDITSLTDEKPD